MNKSILCRIFVVSIIFLVSLSPLTIQDVKAQTENTWTSLAPMQVERGLLGVAVVNKKIYAIGGLPGSGSSPIATNEEYNPTTNTWTFKEPMPTPRSKFAITTYDNKIYCIGGLTYTLDPVEYVLTGVNEVYDPLTDTWETKAPLPTPKEAITANVIDTKIYVIGDESNELWVYDPISDSWSTKTPMPVALTKFGGSWSCSSAVVDNKIHVLGIGIHQIYDPTNDTWDLIAKLGFVSYHGSAGATTGTTAPSQFYTFGVDGRFWTLTYPNPVSLFLNLKDGNWTNQDPMPTRRVFFGIAVVDDHFYAIGGFTLFIGDNIYATGVNERFTPFLFGSIPQISIISPENMIYTKTTIPLEFSVNEAVSWMGYSLGGGANVTITGNTNLTILTEGLHTLGVYVRDIVGDEGSSVVTFTVDVYPPVVFVLSPENRTYGDSNVLLDVEFEEPISSMMYSLDGYENVTFTEGIPLLELEVGSHNVTVYATDLAGHIGVSETIYFSIEPFPTTLAIALVAIIAVVGLGILAYFKKRRP